MTKEEIKTLRKLLRFTQQEFAYKIGVSHCTYNRWEVGKTKPSKLAVEKMNSMKPLENKECW